MPTLQNASETKVLGNLPFLWRPLEAEESNPFPDRMPFVLSVSPETGTVSQVPDPEVRKVLTKSYELGAHIEGRMDDSGIGAEYARDFLDFISTTYGDGLLANSAVLEVGCGTGYLLNVLKGMGAKVMGYEPGFGAIGKYPLDVVDDFFPSAEVLGKSFDLILAYALVEHLEDPRQLLQDMGRHLAPGGLMLIAVPDCEEQIRTGDLSMLIHEHYSYFTAQSLRLLGSSCGLQLETSTKAGFGGLLYVAFSKATAGSDAQPRDTVRVDSGDGILSRIEASQDRLDTFLKGHSGKTVGVFVAGRAVNSLALLEETIDSEQIRLRFFDDSANLQGRYYPGFAIQIEGRESLLADPPDTLLVYTYTFADQIVDSLADSLSDCEVVRLSDLMSDFDA